MVVLVLAILLALALAPLVEYAAIAIAALVGFVLLIYLLQPVFGVLGPILTVLMWVFFAALLLLVAYWVFVIVRWFRTGGWTRWTQPWSAGSATEPEYREHPRLPRWSGDHDTEPWRDRQVRGPSVPQPRKKKRRRTS